ncbi:MAG TPA: endolytic transglycosylase MltG [Candidatus Sulfotelmatobacter sp.]|nr:endolytic transglycosylase MltG [Candidatus Sulfotelmatobacter sp.]
MRRLLWIVLFAVLAVAGWLAWAMFTPLAPSQTAFVLLRPGYSTHRIAAELKSAGVIRSERAFVLWHYLHRRRSLKAGEYRFEKAASIKDVHRRLARGDVYFHTVVIPEGFTMFDIARTIEAAGLGPAGDFLKVAQSDTGLISDIAPSARSLEGYLFPDTYEFTRLMTMQQMAATMVCQFRIVAQQIGLTGAFNVPDGPLSAEQFCKVVHDAGGIRLVSEVGTPPFPPPQSVFERTVIMASIVEKETAVPEERPLVASVYYNRLNKNIALDADPSIIYAELLSGTYQGALHHADMQFSSPYNTYRHAGLPPGPIGNPGKSALEAAMHPAQSDYYYFVADAQGHHRFARTIEEHNKNVIAYRKAMRGR